MFKPCFVSLFAALMCIPLTLYAQPPEVTLEPVVVTATRVETPEEEVGKSVVVITAEDLQQQQPTSLTDALHTLAGIRPQQLRGPGSLQTISIRGVGARYTQILLNGLPVRDASDPQGTAVEFMSDILIEDIERIEIVRGPSSTLYGSDSIGGTINIITKRGTETPEVFASFEGGSFSTFEEVLGVRGANEAVHGSLTVKRLDSEGLDDHDNYEDTSVAGQVGLDFSDTMSIMFHAKYSDSKLDLNSSPGLEDGVIVKDQDDPDDTKERTLFNGSAVFTHDVSDRLDYNLKLGYVDTERKLYTGPEEDFGYENTSTYLGTTLNVETQVNYSVTDAHLLTGGYEYEAEQYELDLEIRKDEPDAARHAVYLQDSMTLLDDQLNIVPGVRYMDHEQAGSHVDWELSTSYQGGESGVRLHGHVGTGFRAPALYELYGAYFSSYSGDVVVIGNEDLDPAESLGWDAGVEWKTLDEKFLVDVTYFSIDFNDMIEFGAESYENSDGGQSQGIEVETTYSPVDGLTFVGTYTYTDAEQDNGDNIPGVSEHELGLTINYRFLQKFNANLALTMRTDQETPLYNPETFESTPYTEDGYTKVDIAVDYRLNDHFTFWTRVDNLFDTDYTEDFFQAPGIGFYGGVKASL
jgi:vitamin B12 transporter